MSWFILVASAMMEAVWARALAASQSFRKPLPTIVFLIALSLSLAGLAFAMLEIPTGTAYAVWVGTGASLTVIWGIVVGEEPATRARLLLISVLILAVVGLKVVS